MAASENREKERRDQSPRQYSCQQVCALRYSLPSAAKGDSFMLRPSNYHSGDILTFDRAYIDYAKFEEMTEAGVTYVTKMKKNLRYETLGDMMYMTSEGRIEHRVRQVGFTKRTKEARNQNIEQEAQNQTDPAADQ